MVHSRVKRPSQPLLIGLLCLSWAIAIGGCATVDGPVSAPPPPEPPPSTRLPHPSGTNLADVADLFRHPSAPKLEEQKACDAPYRKLLGATKSRQEQEQGTREMLRRDPAAWHWCYYAQIYYLENGLREDNYVEERQKRVMETYALLVPVARGFLVEFRDSRYLRFAIFRYRQTSEWVFYRRLELSPAMTQELVSATNPYVLLNPPPETASVLEKYKIASPTKSPPEPAAQDRKPAAQKTTTQKAPARAGAKAAPQAEAPPPPDSAAQDLRPDQQVNETASPLDDELPPDQGL
ncbi:MAG TPA: hypothetical protein VM598_00740 [Bdellovibrionota bacterium]|nr:hypothetical protein [Bdellovibrionota bacterium]